MANAYGIEGSHLFITGGAGFIGTTLASRLADDNRVTLFDNLHNNALANSPLKEHPNITLVKGDVLDRGAVRAAMTDDVDLVVHCAAIAGVDTVVAAPLKTLEVNIQGTFNVLGAAAELPRLARVVDFSTSEVFGQHAYNVSEFEISPTVTIGEARWTYAVSKLAGEFITHCYHVQHGLPTVTVRPFNIYGPNQVGIGAIHNFVVRAIHNEDLVIHDEGSQIRAWCYIDDFVDGVLRAVSNPEAVGRSFNIGNPRSTLTTYNLAELVIRVAESASGLKFKKMGHMDVALRIPNIQSAREILGFEPRVEIEEGLRRTVAWYRQKAENAARPGAAGLRA